MNTKASLRIVALALCVCAASTTWAGDIYVDADAPGANNGSSWLNAYHYLQDALSVAQFGDTVKVAQGTYKPNQATVPSGAGRAATFVLQNGVTLMGGFAGYGASSSERDPLVYTTILSGDISGNDPTVVDPNNNTTTRAMLTAATRQDNCYNVVTASFTGTLAVLDGFRIVGGNANGTTATRGGGILSTQGSPTIRNCVIQACSASTTGGGLYATQGDPNVAQCTFIANYAEQSGGGMSMVSAEPNILGCRFEQNLASTTGKGGGLYNEDSNSAVLDCTFKKNKGGWWGGGLYNLGGDPNVAGCTFTENGAMVSGGAVANWTGGRPRFTNCQFVGNSVNQEGGAVDNRDSVVRFVSCLFIRNASLSEGGAVYNQYSDANFVNCVLNGNKADYRGGGISSFQSNSRVVNCTFSANTALAGQAMTVDSSSPPETRRRLTVVNSILWDSGSEIENRDSSEVSVTYTTVYGGWSGVHNHQTNPMFADRDGLDNVLGNEDDKLALSKGSECIDSGTNNSVPADIRRDVTGKSRFIDDPATVDDGAGQPPIVDMGAYEYGTDPQGQHPPVANAGPDQTVHAGAGGNANVTLDGSASYDPDGTALLYNWTWTIGSQTYSTTGVKPAISLPVGVHTISLVVSDGALNSNPDTVRITILANGGSAPVANAGPDQTVYTASGGYASVQLDGSGSYDPEGGTLTYSWTWTIGSTTYNTTNVKPSIQLPAGVRNIQLIVYDGTTYSSPDTVQITVLQSGGSAPVANAGQDQTVNATAGGYASVHLDGSESYDPEGSTLTYSWTWTIGSTTYNTTGVNPTIQLPVGVRTVQLVVYDGTTYSNPDTVQITVLQSNSAPVANAGQDRTVYATSGGYASIQLDGSGSYDPEGSSLTYSWTWTIGSTNYNTTGVKPTIQLPVGVRTIQLIVYDGTTYSNPDTVQITVLQSGGSSPIANAGQDKTVYATAGGYASVQLDGSGSYDPEGSTLTYSWTWTIGSTNYSTTGVKPTLQLPVGSRTIQLIVYDGTNYSSPDTVQITVLQSNSAPVANAGQDKSVYAGVGGYASVALDGSASYDPEGSSLTYSWTWTVGSASYSTTGVRPTVQLPVGVRTIQLIVYDGTTYSSPDTVQITVLQSGGAAPVANAGPDRTVYATSGSYASVQLDGSGSYDPEGSSLTYSWTWTIGSTTYNTTGVKPTIQLPVGVRTIQLIVYDGTTYSSPDTVQITVLQSGGAVPVANAGPDKTAYATADGYASVALDGSGSYDPEGSTLQYSWTWMVGDEFREATGVTPTIDLPVGQYQIDLVVFDGVNYSAPDSVMVTVVSPLEYSLYLSPYHVNREDATRYLIVLIVLQNVNASDVDLTVPITLNPGSVAAYSQHASEQTTGGLRTTVVAIFQEDDVLNAIAQEGAVNVTVRGQMTSGQSFQGTGTVWLTH